MAHCTPQVHGQMLTLLCHITGLQVLVIDEISMLSAEFFDCMEKQLRKVGALACLNAPLSPAEFGVLWGRPGMSSVHTLISPFLPPYPHTPESHTPRPFHVHLRCATMTGPQAASSLWCAGTFSSCLL